MEKYLKKLSSPAVSSAGNTTPTLSPEKKIEENHHKRKNEEEEEEKEYDEMKTVKKQKKINESNTALAPPMNTTKAIITYAEVVAAFAEIEATTKRLRITEILKDLFLHVLERSSSDLIPIVYLCCNKLAPAYEGIEIGIGDALLIKAIVNSTGRSKDAIEHLYAEKGDLGVVAKELSGKQKTLFGYKPKVLSARDVHEGLLWIANESGNKSQDKKVSKIQTMLQSCTSNNGEEAKYLIRALQGKLRIGLAEQTVQVALAQAFCLFQDSDADEEDLKQAVIRLKEAYSEIPSYAEVINATLTHGFDNLSEHCYVRAGIPLKPMLAKPTTSVTEVLDRFTDCTFTCEYKYDGERAQIHRLEDGSVRIYSRNSEHNTSKYPDIVEVLPKVTSERVTSFILDSEVVAYDIETKKLLPFQILSTRARKDVASSKDVKVQIIVCAFDLLFLNGKSLLKQPLKSRREALYENFCEIEGKFTFATKSDSSDPEEISVFLADAVKNNCEGLMVKTLEENATYEPSRRSLNWLKLKKDYMAGAGDSLDVVPIGAWNGHGKRTGTYGAYLLATYDPENEEFQTVTKIGTGFSDEQLSEFTTQFNSCIIANKPREYNVSSKLEPDVWFEAKHVWEIKCADLSISPVHTAAMDKLAKEKGIALRFPRLVRVRTDKLPEDATNAEQVVEMYKNQNLAKASSKNDARLGGDDDGEDDEY